MKPLTKAEAQIILDSGQLPNCEECVSLSWPAKGDGRYWIVPKGKKENEGKTLCWMHAGLALHKDLK